MPDFVIIGAMKAATTTVYEYLSRHPQVFMCVSKEPQFFSRDHVYARGEAWYRGLFLGAGPAQICGEASTCYSRWPKYPHAAERIHRHVPGARLIYVMRHPVECAYSHYAHAMQERQRLGAGLIVSFEEFLRTDDEVVCASLYMQQITQYLRYYPRERMHFTIFDDIQADPDNALAEMQRFIGVEVIELGAASKVAANRRGDSLARGRIRPRLQAIRHAPGVSIVVNVLPALFRRCVPRSDRVARGFSCWSKDVGAVQEESRPLLPETRGRLVAEFAASTRDLGEFLGRDLGAWLK